MESFFNILQMGDNASGGQPPVDIKKNRYASFASERLGNDVKWYVDGCSYFWAVSVALEQAQKSIWILDWWLSPELYLRRPPAQYQQYRLDRMLVAAAKRGVKVKIIVYKEVTQALTRKFLRPWLVDYVHDTLSESLDFFTLAFSKLGLEVIIKSLEEAETTDPLFFSPPIAVSSLHTKHALEIHDNIAVFRHPDHHPDQRALTSNMVANFKNLNAFNPLHLISGSAGVMNTVYSSVGDSVLYWAHHEKLCLVDDKVAFMGGLDMCFGRWDTNQHAIADAHPGDLRQIVFPGQDYNNARIMDFQNVQQYDANELDRKVQPRMGWSDISISLRGPAVVDLANHFAQRWNFIYDGKYHSRRKSKYAKVDDTSDDSTIGELKHHIQAEAHHLGDKIHLHHGDDDEQAVTLTQPGLFPENLQCQVVRSCDKWSHGVTVEHSIINAYIDVIKNSEHFVYIENQFFISATSSDQMPIENRIAGAIVERIVRAARERTRYQMIVVIPAVPGFAGSLRADGSLGTRAIMEFQYFSICRGGFSIYEKIRQAGFEPMDYIRFYNLRNYDRLNVSGVMKQTEHASGVSYQEAQVGVSKQYVGAEGMGPKQQRQAEGSYNQEAAATYNQAAAQSGEQKGLGSGRWDTVAECYMLNGPDIRSVPWVRGNVEEIDAFVSEELYVHSKVLIADDRVVICGSANLNDRSQLGSHDSEIALVISGPLDVKSKMSGAEYPVNKFAASLRRQLFRKHLGLIPAQDPTSPDDNYMPVDMAANSYDWGSREDAVVQDPLDEGFLKQWRKAAQINMEVFERVFHVVPSDRVKNWRDYEEYHEKHFREIDPKAYKLGLGLGTKPPGKYKVGHVVREDFPNGVQEVKDLLSRVQGSLVEMPLQFLQQEDIAVTGLELNTATERLYT